MNLRAATAPGRYAPMPHDQYYTPTRHVRPLIDYAREIGLFPAAQEVWECAAGAGHVARALSDAGFRVLATDLHPPPAIRQLVPVARHDFLTSGGLAGGPFSICTNPPYGRQSCGILAFLAHALHLMEGPAAGLALLLPFEFDARANRNGLVGEHPWWCGKITIAERIRWASLPQKSSGPMGHHAWFCWSSDALTLRRARRFPSMVAR